MTNPDITREQEKRVAARISHTVIHGMDDDFRAVSFMNRHLIVAALNAFANPQPIDSRSDVEAKGLVPRWTDAEWHRLNAIIHKAIVDDAPALLSDGQIDVLADAVTHALDDDNARVRVLSPSNPEQGNDRAERTAKNAGADRIRGKLAAKSAISVDAMASIMGRFVA